VLFFSGFYIYLIAMHYSKIKKRGTYFDILRRRKIKTQKYHTIFRIVTVTKKRKEKMLPKGRATTK